MPVKLTTEQETMAAHMKSLMDAANARVVADIADGRQGPDIGDPLVAGVVRLCEEHAKLRGDQIEMEAALAGLIPGSPLPNVEIPHSFGRRRVQLVLTREQIASGLLASMDELAPRLERLRSLLLLVEALVRDGAGEVGAGGQ